MRFMRIKPVVCGVLVMALALSGILPTQANAAPQRDNVPLEQMVYKPLDLEEFSARAKTLQQISDDAINAHGVLVGIRGLERMYIEGATALAIAEIRCRQDVTDHYWAEQAQQGLSNQQQAQRIMLQLSQDLLHSACGDKLREQWGEEFTKQILAQRLQTEAEMVLQQREKELLAQYDQAYLTAFNTLFAGKWFMTGNPWEVVLPKEQQMHYWQQAFSGGNAILAPIFLELVQVRTELAKLKGYSSYHQYAYGDIYGRDYLPEDVVALRQQVVQYMVPLLAAMMTQWQQGVAADLPSVDVSADNMVQLLAKELSAMAPEMTQSFSYMLRNELYGISANKQQQTNVSYTAFLAEYQAPYTQMYQRGNLYDLLNFTHELGHYNNYYQNANDYSNWLQPMQFDLAEVHAQGLEMLLCSRYDSIWGRESGQAMQLFHLIVNLDKMIQSCMEDEFQQNIYAQPDMTVEEINTLYGELKAKYQVTSLGNSDSSWVLSTGIFHAPLYAISYATSMSNALELWTKARQDEKKTVKTYLNLVKLGERQSYRAVLQQCGLKDPLVGDTIKRTAQTVGIMLGYHQGRNIHFLDTAGHWAEKDIDKAVQMGISAGVEPMIYAPEAPLSRAMAVVMLGRTLGADFSNNGENHFTDVDKQAWYAQAVAWAEHHGITGGVGEGRFAPDEPITREALAVMLDKVITKQAYSAGMFKDNAAISPWALPSVYRLKALGIMGGREPGEFAPQASVSRAEAAAIFLRLAALPKSAVTTF